LIEIEGGMSEEKREEASFESSLKLLEEAVDQLEVGNLPLSDALRLFEQGLKASNVCRARLEEAKQKVNLKNWMMNRKRKASRLRMTASYPSEGWESLVDAFSSGYFKPLYQMQNLRIQIDTRIRS
jgi:exodeoxyribonuclease VII small subunit